MIDIEQRRRVQELIQEGKYDSAEKVLNRMMDDDPEEASIHNTLGDVLMKLERKEEALEHFGLAGQFYCNNGLHSAALSVARKALRVDTTYALAHFIKAVSYELQEKFEDAKQEYLMYLKSKPSLKELPVLKSCHAMMRLETEDSKWVIRFAKVAAAIEDEVSLKYAINTAKERGIKEQAQLESMLASLIKKLRPEPAKAKPKPIPAPPAREPEPKKTKPEPEKPKPEPEKPKPEPEKPKPEPEVLPPEKEPEPEPEKPKPEPEKQKPEPRVAPPEKKSEPMPEPEIELEPDKELVTEILEEELEPAEVDTAVPTATLEEVEFEESDFMESFTGDTYDDMDDTFSPLERKRIGEYFIAEGLLEASDVLKALEIQKDNKPDRKLGDILVGMNLVSARQLQEALSLQVEDMRRNLDRSRGDGLGYVELGNLLLEVGDFYGAIDSYLRACTIYRANEREYMVFELLEGVLDICPESLSAAKEIVRIRKAMDTEGQARAFYRLAVAYLLNDSPHEALASLEKAVSVDPSFEMARTLMEGIRPGLADSEDYTDIAMILADIDRKFDKNSAKALASIIREFQEGIDTAVPIDDYNTHYDLGIAYMEMGLYRESLSEFEQVLKSPDFRMKAREMLGRCCLYLERYDEAEDHFRKGLSTAAGDLKSSVGFHLAIADVYRATGRISQADRELAAASKLDPEMVKVQHSLE
jgi:tetratricopeptide (TPR) repeat protein